MSRLRGGWEKAKRNIAGNTEHAEHAEMAQRTRRGYEQVERELGEGEEKYSWEHGARGDGTENTER
jgi:hypothetical protein